MNELNTQCVVSPAFYRREGLNLSLNLRSCDRNMCIVLHSLISSVGRPQTDQNVSILHVFCLTSCRRVVAFIFKKLA